MSEEEGTSHTGEAVDAGEAVEVGEAATGVEGESHEDPSAFSIDELIAAEFDDPVMQGEHKLDAGYNEILRHIPENGRKVIQNLRSSYTRKTQELAEARRQLEAEKQAFLQERELLSNSEFAQQIRSKAASEEEYDIWDDEGRRKEIERQAARQMQELLKPMQQEIEAQKRQMALNSFKAEHPDLADLRVEMAHLMLERKSLSFEDAYYIVKAKKTEENRAKEAEQSKLLKEKRREALYKTSTGRTVTGTKVPQFDDAYSAYLWHKQNQTNK